MIHLYFRQIIQENSVWSALNFFYVSIMFHIYKIWKDEHKTIKDSGYVLKGNGLDDKNDKIVNRKTSFFQIPRNFVAKMSK